MSDPQGKKVDEDWKRRAQEEKDRLSQRGAGGPPKIEVPPGVRREAPPPPAPESKPRAGAAPGRTPQPQEPPPEEEHPDYPEITFESFVSGIVAQALVALGQMPHPESGRRELDLEGARYTIDTLAMLQKKTVGNLTPTEKERFDSMVSELQMIFVQISNRVGQRR